MSSTESPWFKVAQFCIPLVFLAGGVYAGWAQNSKQIDNLVQKTDRSAQAYQQHLLSGHALTNQQLESLTEAVEALRKHEERQGQLILAICTKLGATCRRL